MLSYTRSITDQQRAVSASGYAIAEAAHMITTKKR